jgi:hypothetical protein
MVRCVIHPSARMVLGAGSTNGADEMDGAADPFRVREVP